MRKLLFALLLLTTGCSVTTSLSPDPARVKEFISICLKEFNKRGVSIDAKIDRVYILAAETRFELMFAEGEFGTFGARSDNYRLRLICGITEGDPIRINYLGEPLSKSYVETPAGLDSIMTNPSLKSKSVDMLYLRRGSEFEFSRSQKNNRDAVYEELRKKAEAQAPADGTVELR